MAITVDRPTYRRPETRPPRVGAGAVLLNILLSAVAVLAAAHILPGVDVANFESALIAAVVLGLINAFIRPILLVLTLPINILTLGLFTLVVIGACVMLAARIVPGFEVAGFLPALGFAILLWAINALFNAVT